MSGSETSIHTPSAELVNELTGTALYPGDHGLLGLEARRVLVQLLSGPCLDAQRHGKLWATLLGDEALIRSRLADLFLELVMDRDQQVAFTRQADTGDVETPILLRRVHLTFLESLLVLNLRQRLSQAEARAERAVVSIDELQDQMTVYEKSESTDRAGFAKRVAAAIEKMKKHTILNKIRASEDRFEVSPTLKLLFSAEEIASLTTLYNQMTNNEMPIHEESDTQ